MRGGSGHAMGTIRRDGIDDAWRAMMEERSGETEVAPKRERMSR